MRFLVLIIALLIISSCSQNSDSTSILFEPQMSVLEKLYSRHQQWQGSPYQLGGNSKTGIDCSGFIKLTFQQEFNLQLPRTTLKLSKLENEIAIGELKAGDLVFFKIIDKTNLRHVGVYLENNKFLHASTSDGVTISNIKSEYWSQNYWKSIRVLVE
jgi:cell wall-associated NlpC family hydrolase